MEIRSPRWACLTPKAALSRTVLQSLAGLGLDTAARASGYTARPMGSVLLLKGGEAEGWDCR